MSDPLGVVLGALGTIVAAVLLFYGTRFTANRAREGVQASAQVDAQTSALTSISAYNQQLLDDNGSLRTRLDSLEKRLDDEADARRKVQREADDRLTKERQAREEQVQRLTERIDLLNLQLTEWKRLAKVIARWATRMRDELIRLNGTVPATPEELLTLQAIDDAEQDRLARDRPDRAQE